MPWASPGLPSSSCSSCSNTVKEIFLATSIAAILISGVVALHRWGQRKSDSIVLRWAEKNHFQLLQFRERALFESAPFPFLGSNKTPNYFVRVRDERGKERQGWMRVGTIFGGIWEDEIEVKWDGEFLANP